MERRGPVVGGAAEQLAQRLARSEDQTARWVGKDALRDFAKARARAAQKLQTTK
jgi:hypothetical protein